MATTKTTKASTTSKEVISKATTKETAKEAEVKAQVQESISLKADDENKVYPANFASDPMAQLMEMMQGMSKQISSLSEELNKTKAELAETKEIKTSTLEVTANDYETTGYLAPVESTPVGVAPQYNVYNAYQNPGVPSLAEKYIETIANRKSDKEVTIVHNREIIGGACTYIKLSNVAIEFRKLGETRTLSWNQFEELASKYRGFFNRQIILVADKDRAVAEEYVLPCVKRPDGIVMSRTDIDNLPNMNTEQLTKLYNSLTAKDKEFMLQYWLGQCYNRTPGYYERYKIEALNALSGNGMFDALLAFMNGEALNAGRQQNQQGQNQGNGIINLVGKTD